MSIQLMPAQGAAGLLNLPTLAPLSPVNPAATGGLPTPQGGFALWMGLAQNASGAPIMQQTAPEQSQLSADLQGQDSAEGGSLLPLLEAVTRLIAGSDQSDAPVAEPSVRADEVLEALRERLQQMQDALAAGRDAEADVVLPSSSPELKQALADLESGLTHWLELMAGGEQSSATVDAEADEAAREAIRSQLEQLQHLLLSGSEQQLAPPSDQVSKNDATERVPEMVRPLLQAIQQAREQQAAEASKGRAEVGRSGAAMSAEGAQAAAAASSVSSASGESRTESARAELAALDETVVASGVQRTPDGIGVAAGVEMMAAADAARQIGAQADRLAVSARSEGAQVEQAAQTLAQSRAPEAELPLRPASAPTSLGLDSRETPLRPAELLAGMQAPPAGERMPVQVASASSSSLDELRALSPNDERQAGVASRQDPLSFSQPLTQMQAALSQGQSVQTGSAAQLAEQNMLANGWGRMVGERAVMMAQQGPRVAEIRLDPPELGSIRIRVQIHAGDQVSISFTAPNAAVRDAVEQQLPRLREMFAEQGMNLADASVADQSASEREAQREQARAGGYGAEGQADGDAEVEAVKTKRVGLVDYYA